MRHDMKAHVFINDLPLVLLYCLAIMFADDTNLVISGFVHEKGTIINKLTRDMESIVGWMERNRLQLMFQKLKLWLLPLQPLWKNWVSFRWILMDTQYMHVMKSKHWASLWIPN